MAWPSARLYTAVSGGAWGWDKMNDLQDWLLRPSGLVASDLHLPPVQLVDDRTTFALSASTDGATITAAASGLVRINAAVELYITSSSLGGTWSIVKNSTTVLETEDYMAGLRPGYSSETFALTFDPILLPVTAGDTFAIRMSPRALGVTVRERRLFARFWYFE